MKVIIDRTVIPGPLLTFKDLKEGDIFLIGNDYESLFLKLHYNFVPAVINSNRDYNAVSLISGKCTTITNTTAVRKLIKPLHFTDTDFINHVEPENLFDEYKI